jgi:hypothetical protein
VTPLVFVFILFRYDNYWRRMMMVSIVVVLRCNRSSGNGPDTSANYCAVLTANFGADRTTQGTADGSTDCSVLHCVVSPAGPG